LLPLKGDKAPAGARDSPAARDTPLSSSAVSEQTAGQRAGGLPESLRAAIERTLEVTASSAATTRARAQELVGDVAPAPGAPLRGRAGELLDEVARLGREAGQQIARRGREAGEAVGLAGRGELARLETELGDLRRRVENLERLNAERGAQLTEPEVEG
jgi:polyhydroxyalkanoate synthesis regulator phasin